MIHGMKISGIIELRNMTTGEVLFEFRNTIHEDLYNRMVAEIELTSLFDDDEIEPGNAQDGNDGITVYDNDNSVWLSTITTEVAGTQTYSRKWMGEITSTATRDVTEFSLGESYQDTTPFPFNSVFAFKVVNPVELVISNDYQLTWEVFFDQCIDIPPAPET